MNDDEVPVDAKYTLYDRLKSISNARLLKVVDDAIIELENIRMKILNKLSNLTIIPTVLISLIASYVL